MQPVVTTVSRETTKHDTVMLFSYVGNVTSKNDQCTAIVYETVHSAEAVL